MHRQLRLHLYSCSSATRWVGPAAEAEAPDAELCCELLLAAPRLLARMSSQVVNLGSSGPCGPSADLPSSVMRHSQPAICRRICSVNAVAQSQ